jgi:serine/threonine protein kinase
MDKKWTIDPLLLGEGAYGVVVFPGPKNINNEGRSINYLNRPAKIMTNKYKFNKSVNNAKTIKRLSNVKYNFQPYKRKFTKKNLPRNIRNMNIFEWINNDDEIYLAHMPYLGESIFKIKKSPILKNKILQIPVSVYMRNILKLFKTIKDFSDKGYTHGDLHSGNVLIHPNTGEMHIIDFDMFGSSNNSPDYDLDFRLQYALRTLFTDILNTPQYQEFGQFIMEDIIPKMKSDSIQEIIDSIQTFIDTHSTYTSLNLMYLRPKAGGKRLRKSKRKTQKGGKAYH